VFTQSCQSEYSSRSERLVERQGDRAFHFSYTHGWSKRRQTRRASSRRRCHGLTQGHGADRLLRIPRAVTAACPLSRGRRRPERSDRMPPAGERIRVRRRGGAVEDLVPNELANRAGAQPLVDLTGQATPRARLCRDERGPMGETSTGRCPSSARSRETARTQCALIEEQTR
jgi:hypothetical protein